MKQEPVAWMFKKDGSYMCFKHIDGIGFESGIPLYTTPQTYCPSEHNEAYEKGFIDGMQKQMQSSVDRFVNATPQYRELSDEDILKLARSLSIKEAWITTDQTIEFANAVLKKASEK